MRLILISLFIVFIGTFSNAQMQQNDFPSNWVEYAVFEGIKVEFKALECNNAKVKNQVLVVFRYTNTTNKELDMTWSIKEWRNEECSNCYDIDSHEYARAVRLSPGEVIEGDGTTKENKNVYVFSNFINLIKGMSDQKLTAFEFVNVNIEEN